MYSVRDKEPKTYEFSWELIGYDSAPEEVCSPRFKVSFEVTEWYMKLDLSKIKNVDYSIPLSLERVKGVGPSEVTLDIVINVTMSDYHAGTNIYNTVTFNDKENSLKCIIPVKLEKNKSEDQSWLTSKNLKINLKMRSVKAKVPEFSGKTWKSSDTKKAVVDALKALRPDQGDPSYYDLVLKVTGVEFKLHKFILSTRWPQLISTLDISAPSDELETKEFSDIPHALLKNLLNFAYYADVDFMYKLPENDKGPDVFDVVKKYNFYRLNDQITQLSSKCDSTQVLQSYRTSVAMQFTNVTSTESAMGDFRTCEIPLKPAQLPKSSVPMDLKQIEKFQRHIRFMDLRLYVEKGPLGFNWLRFSIVLGKLPGTPDKPKPVTIKCKLYVIDESEEKKLLTEQHFVFMLGDKGKMECIDCSNSFSTKKSLRYRHISEPVITWEELIDEKNRFMRKRLVTKPPKKLRQKMSSVMKSSETQSGTPVEVESLDEIEAEPELTTIEEKDIHFRLELKLTDGEYVYDVIHGPCVFEYKDLYKVFPDMLSMKKKEEFADIVVNSGDKKVKAHKAILVVRSPKIKNSLQRTRRSLKSSLTINIKPEYLEMFIDYFYTGEIPEVPYDEIEYLISVAKEYEMRCLEDLLSEERTKMKQAEYTAMEDGSLASDLFHADIHADITR